MKKKLQVISYSTLFIVLRQSSLRYRTVLASRHCRASGPTSSSMPHSPSSSTSMTSGESSESASGGRSTTNGESSPRGSGCRKFVLSPRCRLRGVLLGGALCLEREESRCRGVVDAGRAGAGEAVVNLSGRTAGVSLSSPSS